MTNTELIRQEIERRIGAMYNFSSGYSALNTCRELLDFIDSLPKETPQGWISVKERLPEKNGFYITCINVQGVPQSIDISYFDKTRQTEWIDNDSCDAWMPIPKFKEE